MYRTKWFFLFIRNGLLYMPHSSYIPSSFLSFYDLKTSEQIRKKIKPASSWILLHKTHNFLSAPDELCNSVAKLHHQRPFIPPPPIPLPLTKLPATFLQTLMDAAICAVKASRFYGNGARSAATPRTSVCHL